MTETRRGEREPPCAAEPRGNATEHHRLERDAMHDVRTFRSHDPADLCDVADSLEQAETLAYDIKPDDANTGGHQLVAMLTNPRRDDHLKTCGTRRPRHRQEVRHEEPVLGHQI